MMASQYPFPVEDEIQAATIKAEYIFRSLGANMREAQLPFDLPFLFKNWGVVTGSEVYNFHARDIEKAELPFDPWVRQRILAGKSVRGSDYVAAKEHRRLACAKFAEWMFNYDLILSPTVPVVACTLAQVDEAETQLETLTRWVNYVGGCAISLPAGFSSSGLPIGVQLSGAAWNENLLLEASMAFQQATDWHRQSPSGLT